MQKNSSGFTMIVLLVAVFIVSLLFIYSMNKLYFRQSKEMQENDLPENNINQPVTLPNAQNQVDAVRNRMNEIQNDYNKKLNGASPEK